MSASIIGVRMGTITECDVCTKPKVDGTIVAIRIEDGDDAGGEYDFEVCCACELVARAAANFRRLCNGAALGAL